MISKILFFGFIVLCQIPLFAQETETVVIKKATSLLYRGVLAETKTWYLLIDENGDYAHFSSGDETVDSVAPGVNINSTFLNLADILLGDFKTKYNFTIVLKPLTITCSQR